MSVGIKMETCYYYNNIILWRFRNCQFDCQPGQMMPAISVAAQEEKQQEVTVERASELVYGEQYLLVGGTAGKTSGSEDDLYAVVGATTHSGSKAGSVLDKVEVSGLDFSDAEN